MAAAGLEPSEPRGSRDAFRGGLFRVSVETWPEGSREIVHHPGACAIVATTPSGDVILVRQIRRAVRAVLFELPAGVRDIDGETAPACAARELIEETGYRAGSVEPLATVLTSPGFADERIDLFRTSVGEEPVARPAEGGVEPVRMTFEEALRAVRDGRITDAKTMVGLLLVAGGRAGSP